MSRSGYSDDLEPLELGRWRGRVASAIRGKRGQAFLKEMLAALDALPAKRLIAEDLESDLGGMPFHRGRGDVCALGAVGKARGMDMTAIDPEDRETLADAFGILNVLACEIMFHNDDYYNETPEARFARMRKWVVSQINNGK